METYGKKKKTLMGSFASLRNSQYNKSKKNRANKRESNTRQLSAFHPTSDIEKQVSVEEGPNEEENGLAEEPVINQPHNTTTTIENTLPQLPSLNFSEKEMWIAGKGTATEANNSNVDCHTGKASSHTRKNSAPPIPRKSSKRQSALTKTARRRSPTKDSQTRRFPKEPISRVLNGFNEKSHPAVSPSDPNAINASVAQTLKAMEELKPGSTNTLVVEKKRRLKAGAFLKVKNVLQGSFRRRKNDISQGDSLVNPALVVTPQIQEHVLRRSESVSDIDLRLNEVQNLKDSAKLQNLTGNPIIHRKPINTDGRSFHSQQSALTDPFTEPPSSSDQTMPPSTFNSQMLGIGSLPEFSSPPRTNKVSSHRNNKGFDDLDSLLTSSPLAQSTPRLRLECNHTDPDRSRRMQKVDAGSPSVLDHDAFIENSQVYQGMLADSPVKVKDQNQPEHLRNLVQQVGMLREKTVNNFVAAVQTLSGSTSDSGFAPLNRKWKKNPSPSKARLEELSRNLPYFPEPEPILYRAHKHKDSNDIHKATFALREKRKNDNQENKELLEGLLTSDEESQDSEESEDTEQSFPRKANMLTRASTSLPLINLSSRPISASQSSPTLGVEGLEVRASVQPRNIMDQDDSMMDLDELQLVTPPLPTQSFHSNESCDDLIAF